MSDRPPSSRTVFRASPLQELKAQAAPALPSVADQPSSLPAAARDDVPAPPRPPSPRNSLMSASESLLALLASVRAGRAQIDLPKLHGVVADAITQFGESVRGTCPEEQAKRSAYALCATADDIVLNLPGQPEQTAQWAQRSMVVRFFGEAIGGDRFWALLDQMVGRPSEYLNVIELYHACMAAGFMGRYRVAPNGKADHQAVMQRAYQALEHPRRVSPSELSPNWRGVLTEMSSLRFWTPLSLAAGGAALLLLLIYGGLRWGLSRTAQPAEAALASIYDQGPLTLGREAKAPAAPACSERERIAQRLGSDVGQGRLIVDCDSKFIRVRAKSSGLFASASASLKEESSPLLQRIAKAVDPEKGKIIVEGYTDNRAVRSLSIGSNKELSARRAENVGNLMAQWLSNPSRISAEGKGEQDPIASNNTAQGQAVNRRVEIALERND